MHPSSHECARCGMAVPARADRCPSCRSRRRVGVAAATAARSGPGAGEAWERVRAEPRADGPPPVRPDVRRTRPVGPEAVAAHGALRLAGLAAALLAAVTGERLLLVVLADDMTELGGLRPWTVLHDVSDVVAVANLAGCLAAAALVARWSAAAGHNLRVLGLHPQRWARSGQRVLARLSASAALAVGWWWAPPGPDRLDAVVELALAAGAAGALAATTRAARRLLLAVTTVELHEAEFLARVELAGVERPRHHLSPLP